MITGYLRGELGFTGLVITDSMAMHGVTDAYSSGDAAIAAIEAGVDIILMPEVLSEAFDAVVAAVETARYPKRASTRASTVCCSTSSSTAYSIPKKAKREMDRSISLLLSLKRYLFPAGHGDRYCSR